MLWLPRLAGAAEAPSAVHDLPRPGMQALLECQDAYQSLEFDKAEALAARAIQEYPQHPLPRLFLQASLIARIQEMVLDRRADPALVARFEGATSQSLAVAQSWGQLWPGPRAQLYLGTCLGARGMVRLYCRSYLAAYRDGQQASRLLSQARAGDPGLADACFGLGQYEYECSRMAGVLRLVLGLHGDAEEGLRLLERAAEEGECTAIPARACLARIYLLERPDPAKALPYVKDIYARYPLHYCYAGYALKEALALGLDRPEAQELMESLCRAWDQGWRPPSSRPLGLDAARAKLAQAYLAEGRPDKAAPHLRRLAALLP
jgi:hypothetical protein